LDEVKKPAKRWTAKRKVEVIMEGLRGETTPAEIARKYCITRAQYFEWRDLFMETGMAGLRSGGEDDPRVEQMGSKIKHLQQMVGQLTEEKQILQEALGLGKKGAGNSVIFQPNRLPSQADLPGAGGPPLHLLHLVGCGRDSQGACSPFAG
jgi:transposase